MSEWIKKADRPPTKADCDPLGCVVVYHIYQGTMVYGLQNFLDNEFMTHWMKTPPPPEEYRKGDKAP